jgi:predicted RNase H-like HicB family nuclease
MSARSRSSRASSERAPATDVVAEARRRVERYHIVLVFEDGVWFGRSLEMPMVFGEGASPGACVRNTREALAVAAATMIEDGRKPPHPATQGVRSEQVNVRLTPEEKALLEEAARRKGFRGLGDFIRTGALAAAQ